MVRAVTRRGRAFLWAGGGAAVLAVTLLAGFVWYASTARVEVLAGYVVEPGGRVVNDEEGAELRYPDGAVARPRLRLPVRNTSRLPVTVEYPRDMSVPFGDWPTDSVRIGPGDVAWLAIAHDHHGCAVTPQPEGGWLGYSGVTVVVTPWGGGPHEQMLGLPVPIRVPAVQVPDGCRPETRR